MRFCEFLEDRLQFCLQGPIATLLFGNPQDLVLRSRVLRSFTFTFIGVRYSLEFPGVPWGSLGFPGVVRVCVCACVRAERLALSSLEFLGVF